jgi:hypothetical protein
MFGGLGDGVSFGHAVLYHMSDYTRAWDGVITSSSNLARARNEATALRNRQEFERSQLTELASTDFESWAKELRDCDEDRLPERQADWESEGRQYGLRDGRSGSGGSCGLRG